jgi:hypothetical protein
MFFGMTHHQNKILLKKKLLFSTCKDMSSCVLNSFVKRDKCLNTKKQNKLKSFICVHFFAKETILKLPAQRLMEI